MELSETENHVSIQYFVSKMELILLDRVHIFGYHGDKLSFNQKEYKNKLFFFNFLKTHKLKIPFQTIPNLTALIKSIHQWNFNAF